MNVVDLSWLSPCIILCCNDMLPTEGRNPTNIPTLIQSSQLLGWAMSIKSSSRKKCIEWNKWKKSCQQNKVGSWQFSFAFNLFAEHPFSGRVRPISLQWLNNFISSQSLLGKFLPCFDLRLRWWEINKPVRPMFVFGWCILRSKVRIGVFHRGFFGMVT